MSRTKTVPIDGEKLKNLITATGRTLPDASEELGFSRKYLSDICRDNRAPVQSMSLIALILNIPQELYKVREPDLRTDEPLEAQPEEPNDSTEIMKAILVELRKIKELIKEDRYEQKSWALPFSNPGDCNGHRNGSTGV